MKIEVKKSLIRDLNIVFNSNSSTVKLYTLTDQINYTELARWIPDPVGNDIDKETFSQHNLTIMLIASTIGFAQVFYPAREGRGNGFIALAFGEKTNESRVAGCRVCIQ
jgi:hypothetical protein